MFKRWKMDQEYRELCAEEYSKDKRLSEVAAILVLAHTGVILSEELIHNMANQLSNVAIDHGLEPEEIQSALIHSEPTLRASTLDF